MDAEIFWTQEGDEGTDLIPGEVIDVRKIGRELRIFFSAQHADTREFFEGVLRLRLRQGHQEVSGKQDFKEIDGQRESVPFFVSGAFQDARCENFAGVWTERGIALTVEVVGLPYFGTPNPPKKKRKAVRPDKPTKRRLAKRSPRKR